SLFFLHSLFAPGVEDFFDLIECHFPLSANLGAWPDDLNPWLGEVQAGVLLPQLGSFLPHCVLYLFLLFSGHGVLGVASSDFLLRSDRCLHPGKGRRDHRTCTCSWLLRLNRHSRIAVPLGLISWPRSRSTSLRSLCRWPNNGF